jgi:nicotinate-nucleotide adenylyltransferase
VAIGFLGGTFDPVHLGHLQLGDSVVSHLGLETVLFVPTGRPWLKAGQYLSPARHRLEMVRRAIAGNARFSLCDVEVERPGLTYTVDTLEELARESRWCADDYLILGMDALEHFQRWKEPERILQLSRLAVAAREGHQGFSLDSLVEQFPEAADRVVQLPGNLPEISATEVRQSAWQGGSLERFVPSAVAEYIQSSGLYRCEAQVDGQVSRVE